MKEHAPPATAVRDTRKHALRVAVSPPFRIGALPEVAEDVASRLEMPEKHKVRILLAIVRALSIPHPLCICRIHDVDRLAMTSPDAFEQLLRSYWILLGARRRAV